MPDMPDPSALVALMPFAVASGVAVQQATPDETVATLLWAPQRCTADGVMHGGAVFTLADSAGAICAYLNLPEGATTTTIDSSIAFLRAIRHGEARAVSRPLHRGRSLLVVRTEVFDADGNLVAHVVQNQAVRPAASA